MDKAQRNDFKHYNPQSSVTFKLVQNTRGTFSVIYTNLNDEISDSRGNEYEDGSILGCCTMFLINVGQHLPVYTAQYPRQAS
jgi:hypothetical protein